MGTPAEPLLALADLLAPKDPGLAREVRLALGDGAAWLKKFRARAEDWWVEEADGWTALIIGLEARGRLCSIDWKFSAADVVWNLERVLRRLGHDPKRLLGWFDEGAHQKTPTDRFLRRAGDALSGHRLALLELDLGSDSYLLTVLPWEQLGRATTLAKQAGQRMVRWAPARPRSRPLPDAPKAPPRKDRHFKTGLRASARSSDPRGPIFGLGWNTPAMTCFELASWPPKPRQVVPFYASQLVHSSSGALLANGTRGGPDGALEGTLLFRGPDGGELDLRPRLPRGVELSRVGFAGEAVVVFPTEPSYRGNPRLKGPLWWSAGDPAFSPIPGLPAVKVAPFTPKNFPPFCTQGLARTGSGEDVLLWNGRGYLREGARFREAFALGATSPSDRFPTTPGEGDSFFFVARDEVRQARQGGKPVRRMAKAGRISELSAGPAGVVLALPVRRDSKAPALLVWWPAERALAKVPASFFGLKGDEGLQHPGHHPKSGLVWCVAGFGAELRAVEWQKLAGLPRLSEDSGRPLKP